jgi:hypothetical protein
MMTKDALRQSIFVMMVLLLSLAVLTQHQLSLQQQPLSSLPESYHEPLLYARDL